MKNIRAAFFLVMIFIFSSSKAEIYLAESLEEINNTILELLAKRNTGKTLLIMPLEGVLIEPVDKEFFC